MSKASFTKSKQAEFLAHLRAGMRRGAAADALQIGRPTMRNFIDEHPDFEEQVRLAEIDAHELVEEALFQAAVSGNVQACRAWLELRSKARDGAQRVPSLDGDDDEAADDDDLGLGLPANVTSMDPRRRNRGA